MYDSNLPPQLSHDSSFNNEPEPKMKECPDCKGLGVDSEDGHNIIRCLLCKGEGETEMTWDEIREERKEPNNL